MDRTLATVMLDETRFGKGDQPHRFIFERESDKTPGEWEHVTVGHDEVLVAVTREQFNAWKGKIWVRPKT